MLSTRLRFSCDAGCPQLHAPRLGSCPHPSAQASVSWKKRYAAWSRRPTVVRSRRMRMNSWQLTGLSAFPQRANPCFLASDPLQPYAAFTRRKSFKAHTHDCELPCLSVLTSLLYNRESISRISLLTIGQKVSLLAPSSSRYCCEAQSP